MTEENKLSRLSHFRVTCPDGSNFTDNLYANGRHQCEVVIEVIKECPNRIGVWERTELTDEEIESIRVVSFFSEDGGFLPSGWSCDERKNIYSEGLWEGDKKVELKPTDYNPGPLVQRVSRYLRFSSQGSMESVRLVACMVLNGQVYKAKSLAEDSGFDSSVTLQPVVPFRLSVKDLVEYKHAAVSDTTFYATVYYWTPPAGVVFVPQEGLDRPLDMDYEGDHFQTGYAYAKQGNNTPHKGGVVVNKENSPVMRSDIFKPYGVPVYNHYVRTDMRPTIMRAITARSLALKVDVTHDSNSTWSLIDNFGNLHQFVLESAGANYEGLRIKDKGPNLNLTYFKIKLPNNQTWTDALYSNGRHQCKVQVEVILEREGAGPVPLTAEQRASVTITRYSTNVHEVLPPGWSCDVEKNMFDTGRWVRDGIMEDEQRNIGPDDNGSVPFSEIIDRYMRFDSTTPIETQKFMARIIIDGVVYTTNPISTPGGSSIDILPIRPYRLSVRDLTVYHDFDAQHDANSDADVFYYNPPAGLRIVSTMGLDNPLQVNDEGDYFQTSFSQKINRDGYRYCKAGVVLQKDVPGLKLRTHDVQRNANFLNPYIEYNVVSTIFRVVKIWTKNPIVEGDTKSTLRVWDNFGCEHRFFIEKADSGRSLELRDA